MYKAECFVYSCVYVFLSKPNRLISTLLICGLFQSEFNESFQWKSSKRHSNELLYQIEFKSLFFLLIVGYLNKFPLSAIKKTVNGTFFVGVINPFKMTEQPNVYPRIFSKKRYPKHLKNSTNFRKNGIQWYSFILTFASGSRLIEWNQLPLSCGQMHRGHRYR